MVRLGPNAMGFAAIHPSVAEVARTLDGPPSLRVTPPLRKRALRYGTAGYLAPPTDSKSLLGRSWGQVWFSYERE